MVVFFIVGQYLMKAYYFFRFAAFWLVRCKMMWSCFLYGPDYVVGIRYQQNCRLLCAFRKWKHSITTLTRCSENHMQCKQSRNGHRGFVLAGRVVFSVAYLRCLTITTSDFQMHVIRA